MPRLFVYGTLAPGRANHGLLSDLPGSWQEATCRGALYRQGWGAAMGYPAIVPSDDGEEVAGFVFSSDALASRWGELDDFEGEGYERVSVAVRLLGGDRVEAFVYALRGEPGAPWEAESE